MDTTTNKIYDLSSKSFRAFAALSFREFWVSGHLGASEPLTQSRRLDPVSLGLRVTPRTPLGTDGLANKFGRSLPGGVCKTLNPEP